MVDDAVADYYGIKDLKAYGQEKATQMFHNASKNFKPKGNASTVNGSTVNDIIEYKRGK